MTSIPDRISRGITNFQIIMNNHLILILAIEAKEAGLVSKVYPAEELVDKAVAAADKIASHSKLITQMCKQATNAAYETTLSEGKKLTNK